MTTQVKPGSHETRGGAGGTLDVEKLRQDFPILQTKAHGKPLVYLDNAATTQKPRQVIEAIEHYYRADNANIHRGVYELSQRATDQYEKARQRVARFLNAAQAHEIIFTRGTTEAINLVANTYGRSRLGEGDEILISAMEHHSNIVPWQMICQQTGAVLKVIPMNDRGELVLEEYIKLLSDRTRLVSVVHVSNSLGTVNPIQEIITAAHTCGAVVMVDGAQYVAHGWVDVQALDVDFYAFSGHKIYGPTGVGVLYGKTALLEAMPPWQGGGDMIASVTFEKTTYAGLPNKFEAGTPHIAGGIGLGAALDYLESVGIEKAAAQETRLLEHATKRLAEVPGLKIVGMAAKKSAVISFVLENPAVSSLDIGMRLDAAGIAVRTGHHCCQPVMDQFHIPSTARASFAFYNTVAEVDALVEELKAITARAGAAGGRAVPQPSDAVRYPKAAAESPAAVAEELAGEFELLGTRDAKNEYVLDLGKGVPALFDMLKKVTPRVQGCMAEVYLVARRSPEDAGTFEFVADANAEIVRGLIAILQRLFCGQKAKDVLAFDTEGFFKRIALDEFITSQRRNGLAGMVALIRQNAAQMVQAQMTMDETRKVPLDVLVHSNKVDELKKNPPARIEPAASGFVPHAMREGEAATAGKDAETLAIEAQIVEKLRTIYDPEIPVNIYDLGLIYDIEIGADRRVNVKMTLTAPGCPVAGTLPPAVERKVEEVAEVTSCKVELVWEPQWTREMMSEVARLELGM